MRKPYRVLKAESLQRAREWFERNTDRRKVKTWGNVSAARRMVWGKVVALQA